VLDGADTDQSDLDLLVDPAESTGFVTLAGFKIDLKVLWTAVRDDLPRLQRQIDDLLTGQRRGPRKSKNQILARGGANGAPRGA
jgi:hypothetical protein